MKRIAFPILLLLAVTAIAASQDYTTPRYGGGYNYYGSGGASGYSTPRYGGGYNFYGSGGSSGYTTPRYGGGHNFYGSGGKSGDSKKVASPRSSSGVRARSIRFQR